MEKKFGLPIPELEPEHGIEIILRGIEARSAMQSISETADQIADICMPPAAVQEGDVATVRQNIGFLVSELLENAIKFKADEKSPVFIMASIINGFFVVKIRNNVTSIIARRFSAILSRFMNKASGDLLIEKLINNAKNENVNESGIGLLTLMSDYDVEMGWKFSKIENVGNVELISFARLPLN